MAGNERGVALILTLWIMVALIILAAGVGMVARTETQIARNFADSARCRSAARAGVYAAIAEIERLAGEEHTYLGEDGYLVSSEEQGIDLGGFVFEAVIEDEGGKFNVNTASVEMLANLFGSSELADCIVDWRDADDTPGAEGAETEYYSSLETPYRARNADFDTLRGLLLVKGITEELLSSPNVSGDRALMELLTVYTQEESEPSGSDLVDIQAADRETLISALGDVLSEQEIDAIISYRSGSAFRSRSEIVRVSGLPREKIAEIFDRLTVSGERAVPGKVNVNTATVDVLGALPGLDPGIAQAIVDYRAASGPIDGVGRLLAVNDVTNQAFQTAAPYLAVRSRVFRIVSIGLLPDRNVSVTIACVVETVDAGPARIKYWQE